ncbi:NAD(P)H-quinone oxidoreductase [Winogradskya consettensis]|uniref:NAD(P)H quinone oxidoreductase n=1 Tax=Winogradskya consettensis TaxID=113560 RepID=A0A919W6F0_9ACTN|nr:NAD(P)H-quinone oxidoreductase [Actinoplanes consettensis]GIM83222.1 NAD(P)H quinone oxidoreductase [Actinoplanes consettensis]
MHAITIDQPGGPEALKWTEVPDPSPAPGEVIVQVTATAVNRADTMQRQGSYPPPPGASPYLGLECSGVIAAVGADVTGHHVGERVCALLAGGGYAEQVAIPAGQLLPIPQGLSVQEAAALPEVACTVWSNVVDIARLRQGQTLLVHGGGGGIGTFAVQLGKALGATVIVTARKQKHDQLKALGADLAIDYTDTDFVQAVKDFTNGHGADVILDIIAAKYLAQNLDAVAIDGHIVTIGMQGGTKAELDFRKLLSKRASLSATSLRPRPIPDKARIVKGVHHQVWPLIDAGTIRPIIDRTFPMSAAADAHRLLETSDHLGKILLLA